MELTSITLLFTPVFLAVIYRIAFSIKEKKKKWTVDCLRLWFYVFLKDYLVTQTTGAKVQSVTN